MARIECLESLVHLYAKMHQDQIMLASHLLGRYTEENTRCLELMDRVQIVEAAKCSTEAEVLALRDMCRVAELQAKALKTETTQVTSQNQELEAVVVELRGQVDSALRQPAVDTAAEDNGPLRHGDSEDAARQQWGNGRLKEAVERSGTSERQHKHR